jgi:toxin-antitoxin system PIN domain toxin
MDLLDANILIGVFRPDDPDHNLLRRWLEGRLNQNLDVTFPPLVEVAFLRIVTNPRIFRAPAPLEEAMEFLEVIQESGVFRETPWTQGMRSQWWRWCQILSLRGDDVNDAYLAASAAGAGCRLVSRDRGFDCFPGLDWWNPVAG